MSLVSLMTGSRIFSLTGQRCEGYRSGHAKACVVGGVVEQGIICARGGTRFEPRMHERAATLRPKEKSRRLADLWIDLVLDIVENLARLLSAVRIGSVYILTPLQHVARRVKEAQIIRFEPAHRPGHTLRVQRKPRISIQKFVAFAVGVRRHRARTGGILTFGFRRKAVACHAQDVFLREHRGVVTVLAFFVTPLFSRNALLLAEVIAILRRSMPIDPNRGQIRQAGVGGVLLAFFVGQVAISLRLWHRVWFLAAEIELFRRIGERKAPSLELCLPPAPEPEAPEAGEPEAGEPEQSEPAKSGFSLAGGAEADEPADAAGKDTTVNL